MSRAKRYRLIYADPAWLYGDKQANRPANYGRMRPQDIRHMVVESLAHDDAVLFLWSTAPMTPAALSVMRAWGFEFKTKAFCWVKTNPISGTPKWGQGHWSRSNTEDCWLGTRGSPKRVSAAVHQLVEECQTEVIRSPTGGEHSQKPAEVRDRIVQLCGDVPRLELFARQATPGWDRWGNEAPAGEGRVSL